MEKMEWNKIDSITKWDQSVHEVLCAEMIFCSQNLKIVQLFFRKFDVAKKNIPNHYPEQKI